MQVTNSVTFKYVDYAQLDVTSRFKIKNVKNVSNYQKKVR